MEDKVYGEKSGPPVQKWREKKEVENTIFWKEYETRPQVKNLPIFHLKPDDFIIVTWVEGFYTENNSCDGYYLIEIKRSELETDKQQATRVAEYEKSLVELKKRRREQYEKLKREFGE